MATQAGSFVAEPTWHGNRSDASRETASTGFGNRAKMPELPFVPVLESRHWSFSEKSPKSLTGYHGMPRPPVVRAKPPSSVIQLSPPDPACAHFSRSAAELRIVSSSTYG